MQTKVINTLWILKTYSINYDNGSRSTTTRDNNVEASRNLANCSKIQSKKQVCHKEASKWTQPETKIEPKKYSKTQFSKFQVKILSHKISYILYYILIRRRPVTRPSNQLVVKSKGLPKESSRSFQSNSGIKIKNCFRNIV